MNRNYFKRDVGDWSINIMHIYRDREEGWILNLVDTKTTQTLPKKLFKSQFEALGFVRKFIDEKRRELNDGEQCYSQLMDDLIHDYEEEEELKNKEEQK